MAIYRKSMLFLATVMKWERRKGDKRVQNETTGTQYLLNTNRLDGMRVMTSTAYTSLYYFDNPFNHRENSAYMEVYLTVAQLKTQCDTTPTNVYMTLPIYPSMNTAKTTVNTTINIGSFAFAVAVADSGSTTDSLVYYTDGAFKLVKCRVALTLAQLLALIA